MFFDAVMLLRISQITFSVSVDYICNKILTVVREYEKENVFKVSEVKNKPNLNINFFRIGC